jgi:hypothetical protein
MLGVAAVCCHLPACKPTQVEVGSEWGVKVSSIRITGADHFVDFRYRVMDPEKASAIMGRNQKVVLVDQVTGTELPVSVNKLGPMKSTAVKPEVNRDYVVLFANSNKVLKPGSRVTVVMGDARLENLTVE